VNRNVELDNIAHNEGIEILEYRCPKNGSMSHMTKQGNCYIGIDSTNKSEQEITVHKAHELGHCMTGAFYNKYSKFDLISKHEYRANKWAIKKLIPKDELIETVESGYTETWQLAEYFEVTEEFIIQALKFYNYYFEAI